MKNKQKYDVVIIGAGPAGLECARQLKNSSLSVLVIEKNKVIGQKICAGGLTNLIADFDLPKNKIRSFKKQEYILNDRSFFIELAKPIKTISRLDLGQYQYDKLKGSKNIKILRSVLVKKIDKKDKTVLTSCGLFSYDLLVGADGANSLVRKILGLRSKKCIGINYNIKEETARFIWYFNPGKIMSGYCWSFPHQGYTSIGAYYDPSRVSLKNIKNVLRNFIGEKYKEGKLEAAPVNYYYRGCIFKDIFLIGDAAGLASKATGEGISYALISGAEIGRKILDPDYKLKKLKYILKFKRRQDFFITLFNMFFKWRFLLLRLFVFLMKRAWFQAYFGI